MKIPIDKIKSSIYDCYIPQDKESLLRELFQNGGLNISQLYIKFSDY